ncbi:hypothetical protein GQX74_011659 [Glossina fuscipes]|nr:hypothetical protein GQX74_011659 [Glossina fuscipes]
MSASSNEVLWPKLLLSKRIEGTKFQDCILTESSSFHPLLSEPLCVLPEVKRSVTHHIEIKEPSFHRKTCSPLKNGLSGWTSFLSRRKATPADDTLKTTILEIMGKTDIVRFNRAGDAVFANGIGCTEEYIKAEIKDNDSCINSTTVLSSSPADVAFPLADNYIQ